MDWIVEDEHCAKSTHSTFVISKCTVPVSRLTEKPFYLGNAMINTRITAINSIGESSPSQTGSVLLELDVPRYATKVLSFGSKDIDWNQIHAFPAQRHRKLSAIGIKQTSNEFMLSGLQLFFSDGQESPLF